MSGAELRARAAAHYRAVGTRSNFQIDASKPDETERWLRTLHTGMVERYNQIKDMEWALYDFSPEFRARMAEVRGALAALAARPGWTAVQPADYCYMPLAHRAEAAVALVTSRPDALLREMARQLAALPPRGRILFVGAGNGELEAALLALGAEGLDVEVAVVEPAPVAGTIDERLWRHFASVEHAREAGWAGDNVIVAIVWPPPFSPKPMERLGPAPPTPSLIGLALEVLEPASMLIVSAPDGAAGVPVDVHHLYEDHEQLLLSATDRAPPPARRLVDEYKLVQSTVYVASEADAWCSFMFTVEVSTWVRPTDAARPHVREPRRQGFVLLTPVGRPDREAYVVDAGCPELMP